MQQRKQANLSMNDVMSFNAPLPKRLWPKLGLSQRFLHERNEIAPMVFDPSICKLCGGKGGAWEKVRMNRSKFVICECQKEKDANKENY